MNVITALYLIVAMCTSLHAAPLLRGIEPLYGFLTVGMCSMGWPFYWLLYFTGAGA